MLKVGIEYPSEVLVYEPVVDIIDIRPGYVRGVESDQVAIIDPAAFLAEAIPAILHEIKA
jgi:hypothetical protein